tara:strand:- start:608 stop:760 length:153 start_codon:yes stop_codon:yes gene_type:complete
MSPYYDLLYGKYKEIKRIKHFFNVRLIVKIRNNYERIYNANTMDINGTDE